MDIQRNTREWGGFDAPKLYHEVPKVAIPQSQHNQINMFQMQHFQQQDPVSTVKYDIRSRRGSANIALDQKPMQIQLRKSSCFQHPQPLMQQEQQYQQQQHPQYIQQQYQQQHNQSGPRLEHGTTQINAYIQEIQKGSTLSIQQIVANNTQGRANTAFDNSHRSELPRPLIAQISDTNRGFLSRRNSNGMTQSRQTSVRSKSRGNSPCHTQERSRMLSTQGSTTMISKTQGIRSTGMSTESEVYCQYSNNNSRSYSNNQSFCHTQVTSCGVSPEREPSRSHSQSRGQFRNSEKSHNWLKMRTQQNSPVGFDEYREKENDSHSQLKFHTEAIDCHVSTAKKEIKILREIANIPTRILDETGRKSSVKNQLTLIPQEDSLKYVDDSSQLLHSYQNTQDFDEPRRFFANQNRPRLLKHVKLAKESLLKSTKKTTTSFVKQSPHQMFHPAIPFVANQTHQFLPSKNSQINENRNPISIKQPLSNPVNPNVVTAFHKANIQISIQQQKQFQQPPIQQRKHQHPQIPCNHPYQNKTKQQRITQIQHPISRENSSTRNSDSTQINQQFSAMKSQYSINLGLKTSSIQIENYKIIEKIGNGSYAIVNLAIDKSTNRKVAIKVYEKNSLQDPNKLKNVKREIQILNQISHFNIIKLFHVINSETTLNLVMEFIGPTSLYSYLKAAPNRRLKEKECKQIFRQVVEGVKYLHSRNIIHRDIKLENLIIDEYSNVKIIDFGFAVQVVPSQLLTSFCGTPSYMAPEIVRKINYCGEPVDVWTCGILLFVLFCGAFPFKGVDEKDLYKKIAICQPELPSFIPEGARNLIARILQVIPEERPTVEEILKDKWVSSSTQTERNNFSEEY